MFLDGVVSTEFHDQVRDYVLDDYNKNAPPPNDVSLVFKIVYMQCPIPTDAGTLRSEVHETQVRLVLLISQAKIQSSSPSLPPPKEVIFLLRSVCLSVCLSVRLSVG